MLTKFLNSKRGNLAQSTFNLYKYCLNLFVKGYEISPQGINSFLADLNCGNAKANYHRVITTFVRWLLKMGYLKENPLDKVDKPKQAKKLLSSLNEEQVKTLISQVDNLRDKALMTVSLTQPMDSDWTQIYLYVAGQTYKRWGKGEMPADIVVDSISDYQMRDLNRLKDWLYRKRTGIRLERDRAERRQRKEEEAARSKAEQPALFEF